jgi:hypothetical protein
MLLTEKQKEEMVRIVNDRIAKQDKKTKWLLRHFGGIPDGWKEENEEK